LILLLVLALAGFALWKLHRDFNDDAIFNEPQLLSNGHVKQAIATGKVVVSHLSPNSSKYWPRFAERIEAYQGEAQRRGLKVRL
jgi:hypothetical protein